MKTILVFILLLFLLPLNQVISQEKCPVILKISGPRADGNGTWESEIVAYKYCEDFTEEQRKKSDDEWNQYYGSTYKMVEPSTMKIDCAGTTFRYLFGKGPYVINAGVFTSSIITWFGKRIHFTPVSWGDVQQGDILVYGTKHITYIESVTKTAGMVTSVTIRTKNGDEPVYTHEIGMYESGNDALIQRFGNYQVYRVDADKITVTEVENCSCNQKGRGYKLASLEVDPDKRNGSLTIAGKPFNIKVNKENILITGDACSYNIRLEFPPEFIPENDVIKLKYFLNFSGTEPNTTASMSYGTTGIDYGFDDWNTGVGRNADTKFIKNSTSGTITLSNINGYDSFRLDPSVNFGVWTSSIVFRIFIAEYVLVK